jgi:hypothetical protein
LGQAYPNADIVHDDRTDARLSVRGIRITSRTALEEEGERYDYYCRGKNNQEPSREH